MHQQKDDCRSYVEQQSNEDQSIEKKTNKKTTLVEKYNRL